MSAQTLAALDTAVTAIIRTILQSEEPQSKGKSKLKPVHKPRPPKPHTPPIVLASPSVLSVDPPEYYQEAEDLYEQATPPMPRLDFVPETDVDYPAPPSPLPAGMLQQAREALAHELTDQELESGILNSSLRPEDIRDASTVAKAQRIRQRMAYPEDRSIGNVLPRSAEDLEYDV